MRKLTFAIVGILSFLSIAAINPVSAQICTNPEGCVSCAYNTATGKCVYDSANLSGTSGCSLGAERPGNTDAICAQFDGEPGDNTNFIDCSSQIIACVPSEGTTVPNGGYYCDNSGTAPRCVACDNNAATSIPACPGGSTAPYSNEASCHASCDFGQQGFNCVSTFEGVCRTSCQSGELNVSQGTCSSGLCCRAAALDQTQTAARIQGSCLEGEVETGVGCIPISSATAFASFFLRWGLGISGGLAIILLVYASFLLMTSAGDPKRLQTGKELLFSVLSGIILLVFSMFVLRILGINVLGLF